MKKINFITNLDINLTSGGWGGINYNIYKELKKFYSVDYVGPINPNHVKRQKIYNKVLRAIGIRSDFSFFSQKRLSIISNTLQNHLKEGDYNFFFGQTCWIDYQSSRPYGVYLDADFKTYLDIFSTPHRFSKKDINRIQKKEERWLQNARDIFVGSEWAWKEMIKYYDLREDQKNVVLTGGNIPLPKSDAYVSGYNFLFISLNFEKKGGFICIDVFKKIKEIEPTATLTILGECPPKAILALEGVQYAGFLKKTNPDDLDKFSSILSKAFLLIHPTKMDTMGAVLIEAGYFGCPSIAPKSFGVPEIVLHKKTGIIINVPFTAQDFFEHIEYLIKNREEYFKLRKCAWNYTRTKLTWENIGCTLNDKISR
jgi:glycosyltransferase involved in cell wall biosynthesis